MRNIPVPRWSNGRRLQPAWRTVPGEEPGQMVLVPTKFPDTRRPKSKKHPRKGLAVGEPGRDRRDDESTAVDSFGYWLLVAFAFVFYRMMFQAIMGGVSEVL